MAAVSSNLAYLSGSVWRSSCRLPSSHSRSSKCQFQFLKVSDKTIQRATPVPMHITCSSAGRNEHHGLSFDDGSDHEPFLLSMIRDVAWSLRYLALFLAEQPSQLKYIEWPTFRNTLKTATLTLVLVALLIVALSTIDASLCYVLSLLTRKTA